MSSQWSLTEEAFGRLLAWLGPGREDAGRRYEEIRRSLIHIFTCRGCPEAEQLADQTIDRVAKKVHQLADSYVGDPALYFYGVAHKVHLEYLRKRPARPVPPPAAHEENIEEEFWCLEHCMESLTPDNRWLVLEYYRDEKRVKIDHRKELARKLGIAMNALRIRAFRIRLALQECVNDCLARRATE